MKCLFMAKQSILMFLLLSVVFSVSKGQEKEIVISGYFHDASFRAFADTLEKTNDLKFFYKDPWIQNVKVKQTKKPIILQELLNATLTGTGLNYQIINNHIIITQNYVIRKELPSHFYNKRNIETSKPAEDSTSSYSFLSTRESEEESQSNDIIAIGNPAYRYKNEKAVLSGYIKQQSDGVPIIGAVIYVDELELGTVSDPYGYYVLNIPRGRYRLLFKCLGQKDKELEILVNDDGTLNVELEENIIQMESVVVSAEKEHNVKGLEMGLNKIEMQTIQRIPSSMGEADMLKSALLLPGVQTVGEGASGFNVRGGSVDQNLILIDGSPIFNSSHLFGFFSAFNPYVVNDFKLYKGSIPPEYGGRISSVFDVRVKNGNLKKFSGNGGISPVTGKLSFEGPIIKERASFLVAGRSTYSNWVLHRIDNPEIKNSTGTFYDVNAKLHFIINENNNLTISGYNSFDDFKLNSDTAYNYQSLNGSIKWKHVFTKKLYGILSGIYSNYRYAIQSDVNPFQAFDLSSDIDYRELKANFSYFPNNNHTFTFGGGVIRYNVNPNTIMPTGETSTVATNDLDNEYALEPAVYINDQIKLTNRLSLNAGFRYSTFMVKGPASVHQYGSESPMTTANRIDTAIYGQNELIKQYHGPSIRLSARYNIGRTSSIKVSYNHLYQYIHMLSNSAARSPTDIWKLSDYHIKPQIGDQYSFGFYKNLFNNSVESSVEMYYKDLKNVLAYKGGAQLLLNDEIETDLINGNGKAYGVELLLKKKTGKLNGWISYTFSSSQLKVDGKFPEEKINNGDYFPADYDKPHDVTLVANYRISRRFNLTSNLTYSQGRPITVPAGKYQFKGREFSLYTKRNEYRVPDYFRWDMALNIERSLRNDKFVYSYWSFSVYNLTGRENVYSIFFKTDGGKVKGYKLSVFAQPIFTISYNFKF